MAFTTPYMEVGAMACLARHSRNWQANSLREGVNLIHHYVVTPTYCAGGIYDPSPRGRLQVLHFKNRDRRAFARDDEEEINQNPTA
jgi:hypothetical protein